MNRRFFVKINTFGKPVRFIELEMKKKPTLSRIKREAQSKAPSLGKQTFELYEVISTRHGAYHARLELR